MDKKTLNAIFKGRNIMVTGCAGFIGWKVAHQLLELGRRVIGVDNINNYYDPALKRWRLKSLKAYPNFIFYKTERTAELTQAIVEM